ncbi:MAG: hypothetical protein WBF71_06470 [Microthrixaceae bacterium]
MTRARGWILRRTRLVLTAVATLLAVLAGPGFVGPVAAEGGGSSSSSIVGRGDILTTITSILPRRNRPTGQSPNPRCRTVVLNDAEIEFLIALVALHPDAESSKEVAQLLRDYLITQEDPPPAAPDETEPDETAPNEASPEGDPAAPPAPPPAPPPPPIEYELRLQICDGVATDIWVSPRPGGTDALTTLGRRMITRLPEPRPVQSPPTGVAVPVNQPVFISIPSALWTPIDATLRSGGLVAEVRAEPVSLRIYSGDGSAEIRECPGRGVRFDPFSPLSPARQSRNPLACTITYRAPTPGADAESGPRSFIGAVTVIWSAEWRAGAGPWRSLGLIPRTRVFERDVREVRTAISALPVRHSK